MNGGDASIQKLTLSVFLYLNPENTNSPPHLLKWPLYLDELGSSAILAIVRCSLGAIS